MLVELLLTEREVKARLKVGRTTLYTLRRSGQLPYVRFRAGIRYRVSDVEALIARFLRTEARHG